MDLLPMDDLRNRALKNIHAISQIDSGIKFVSLILHHQSL
jgi:hypothetical protein